MLLLAIDTAGPDCAAAITRPGVEAPEILASSAERIGRGHAERLMPMIEAVLGEAGISFGNLDRVGATVGPGSFTGVRIGVAAARGLSLALDIPAVGIGSLDALLYPVARRHRAGTGVAVLDARRGEVYALARSLETGELIVEAAALRPAVLAEQLADCERPLVLTGSGAPLVATLLPASDVRIGDTPESPDIADVAALALDADALRPPSPFYARGADAKLQTASVVLP
jgi:tRNA threonylcarbamoyladenosine biosynthesis protein TsaB